MNRLSGSTPRALRPVYLAAPPVPLGPFIWQHPTTWSPVYMTTIDIVRTLLLALLPGLGLALAICVGEIIDSHTDRS